MNISNNNAVRRSVDQIPINQHPPEQTILLNAIRHKFANDESYLGVSPPVFNIPSLKLPQFSSASSLESYKNPSKLNLFILGQLNETKNDVNRSEFVIPNLQIPSKLNSTNLTLTEKLCLTSSDSETSILSLNKSIRDLRVSEDSKPIIIDLTTALNKTPTFATSSPSKQLASNAPNPIDFQIPFIDCDLRETAIKLPLTNEYCQTDVSNFISNSFISSPSRFGKITCLRYRLPKRKRRVDHSFKTKHQVARFYFDTKSPDDIILATLRKYNRV